ncbi:MAG: adenylosuccinate lyase [Chloroflexi bacterium]|nr:adenylosuccinate lyase [Chloroflexota bacterium]
MISRYTLPEMEQIWSDTNKYDTWLKVELAVCWALKEVGTIPKSDFNKIEKSNYNYERLNEILEDTKHDMTAFLLSITEKMGDEGRWIHYGLTTSDVWDTATSIQIVQAAKIILSQITQLKNLLSNLAIKYKNSVMMGRTHGIHAEPMTLGLKFLLWAEEISRAEIRLSNSIAQINFGKISGPVGTNASVSPRVEELTCEKLGISVAPVSNQIIQRDRYADFMTTLAISGGSLEKFATEIRSLQRTEIGELQEPFGDLQTGSSSMPHKKNPDITERICGLSRVLRGNALVALENISLWGERDISHSSAERITLPDSCFTLNYMLHKFIEIMSGLIVNEDKMTDNINMSLGLIYSQRLMLTLISKGMTRDTAYRIVQKNSNDAWNKKIELKSLISKNKEVNQTLSSDEIDEVFDINYYLKNINYKFEHSKLLKEIKK